MGRYLLLADVHANLRALSAVLEDVVRWGGFDVIWMLGDLVGYGPEPDDCVSMLRENPLVSVAGNHDLGAVGRVDLSSFNREAAEVCLWTGGRLSASSSEFLRELPLRQRVAPFLLVHASPRDTVWEYVTSGVQATELALFCEEAHCLVGHTHCPAVFSMTSHSGQAEGVCSAGTEVPVRGRLIVNPGAVGQPRDGDPRAAYAVLDTVAGAVSFHRVPYDVSGTVNAMRRHGLPDSLARRLHAGY